MSDEIEAGTPIELGGLPRISSTTVAEGFGDPAKLLVARNWLSQAMRNVGAEVYAAGVGCGQADLDIVINDVRYSVSIRLGLTGEAA